MGQLDSSRTRVEPVFDRLLDLDPTGRSWLRQLMTLGSRSGGRVPDEVGELVPGHGKRWGASEQRLDPPQSLLDWLLHNLTPEQVAASGDRGQIREEREALARREPAVVAEALRLIHEDKRRRKWCILEGWSATDALIETDSLVLVFERKRTERTTTSTTKWMAQRSQLVRQMDAASEGFPRKTVFGLLLVEGTNRTQWPSHRGGRRRTGRAWARPCTTAFRIGTMKSVTGLVRVCWESRHGNGFAMSAMSRGLPERTLMP